MKKQVSAMLALLGCSFGSFACADVGTNGGSQVAQPNPVIPGNMVKEGQIPAAYNRSAAYDCDGGWDVFITADYIWWDWVQDRGQHVLLPDTVGGATFSSGFVTPGYASGFQVGLGFNMKGMDNWSLYSEYTWYKNSESYSDTTSLVSTQLDLALESSGSGKTSIGYNNLDLVMQRPFYYGKKLTAHFYTGLRALWISNNISRNESGSLELLGLIETEALSIDYTKKNTSWALGPKMGIDSTWLLGYGLKILSNTSISALYTRYTTNTQTNTAGDVEIFSLLSHINQPTSQVVSNYGTLRPVLECFLGLGWGSYFCDNDFHFDLSLGYDFNFHLDYITNIRPNGSVSSSNLFLHGLNVQVRFDF